VRITRCKNAPGKFDECCDHDKTLSNHAMLMPDLQKIDVKVVEDKNDYLLSAGAESAMLQ
jgi:hypothetical protein